MTISNEVKMPLSFTAIKGYEQCPQRFYQERVLKRFPYKQTEQAARGEKIHKELELYILEGKALDDAKDFEPWVQEFATQEGDKFVEHKMAMNWQGEKVGYFRGKDIWIRGQFDLLIDRGDNAVMIDYKTGKSKYADTGQLELMSLLTFIHFPKINTINGALVFLDEDKIITDTYHRADMDKYKDKWLSRSIPIVQSLTTRKFVMKPTPLCAFCPVIDCPHYKGE